MGVAISANTYLIIHTLFKMADMAAAAPLSIGTDSVVSCVEFGPCHQYTALLAASTASTLVIKKCTLKDSQLHCVGNLAEALDCEDLMCIPVHSRVRAMAFSPMSTVSDEELILKLAMADSENKITVISSDITGTSSQVLEGQSKYINDIAFHPVDADLLVSAGDDCEAKQWDVQSGQVVWAIQLSSPGVSVRFHPDQPLQLMVAEKKGCVHIFNLDARLPIVTITCPEYPLLQADWSMSNSLKVGAVAGTSWYVWNISQSSLPLETSPAHNTMATGFRWSQTSDSVFSTTSLAGQLKIQHLGHHKIPISISLPVANGVSWHTKLPIAAVASNQLLFWGVEC